MQNDYKNLIRQPFRKYHLHTTRIKRIPYNKQRCVLNKFKMLRTSCALQPCACEFQMLNMFPPIILNRQREQQAQASRIHLLFVPPFSQTFVFL